MSSAVERFDDKMRASFDRIGQNEVHEGELLRHPVYTRFLHWTVAVFFFLALFSGFGIYLPWLFRWFTPIFGGGSLSRAMHPWFGLGFVIFFALSTFGRWPVAISYVLHDISALVMLFGIFIHIYLSTFGEPGTFQAMSRGVVSEAWAWTFHPAWYKEITGRDPVEACEDARRRGQVGK